MSTTIVEAEAITAVTLPPTTSTVLETTSTVRTTTTPQVDADEMSPEELVSLLDSLGISVVRPDLVPGRGIDPPAGFPSVEDLAQSADGFINAGHPRAQITSYVGPKGDAGELIAGGMLLEVAIGAMINITYFDGVTVWDYGAGVREVSIPGQAILSLDATGQWAESTAFEWPIFGPIPEQHEAQTMAGEVLAADNEVVGYEEIAGVETIRVRYTGEEAAIEVWVSSDALLMRLIYHIGDPEDPATVAFVWNVETLDAVLEGLLPSGI